MISRAIRHQCNDSSMLVVVIFHVIDTESANSLSCSIAFPTDMHRLYLLVNQDDHKTQQRPNMFG
jgi:hypothetical protein